MNNGEDSVFNDCSEFENEFFEETTEECVKQVVWRPEYSGYKESSEDLIGFVGDDNTLVVPSGVNEVPGKNSHLAMVREDPAKLGQMEYVVLVEGEDDDAPIAFPAKFPDGCSPFGEIMPGVVSPFEVSWQENERENGRVIGRYQQNPSRFFWIFPGLDEKLSAFAPYPDRAQEWWSNLLVAGSKTPCWLAWVRRVGAKGSYWCAYAFLDSCFRLKLPSISVGQVQAVAINDLPFAMTVPQGKEADFYFDGKKLIVEVPLE